MSTNLKSYSDAEIYFNGGRQLEVTDVTCKFMGNATEITTMALGFAGRKLGPAKIEASFTAMIPADDFEYNPSRDVKKATFVEFGFFVGGRLLACKGYFTDAEVSAGKDKETSLQLNFVGTYEELE